jgi:hypothetical protein
VNKKTAVVEAALFATIAEASFTSHWHPHRERWSFFEVHQKSLLAYLHESALRG